MSATVTLPAGPQGIAVRGIARLEAAVADNATAVTLDAVTKAGLTSPRDAGVPVLAEGRATRLGEPSLAESLRRKSQSHRPIWGAPELRSRHQL